MYDSRNFVPCLHLIEILFLLVLAKSWRKKKNFCFIVLLCDIAWLFLDSEESCSYGKTTKGSETVLQLRRFFKIFSWVSTDFMQLKINHFWFLSKILKISWKHDNKDFRVTVLLLNRNLNSGIILPSIMLYKTRERKKSLWW